MTTATAEKSATKATSDNGAAPPDATRNLHQRLAAITKEVKVGATGTTGKQAGDRRTISIGDADQAIGPLMAVHGVISDYEFNEEPKSYDQPTKDGSMKMWLVNITSYVANADDPTDKLTRRLYDIGSNPSAAVSFALKRWYRGLFKLVEDDDQDQGRSAASNGGPAPTASLNPDQALEISALNASLPKPYNDTVLTAMSKSGFTAASNALRKAHLSSAHCGESCPHIAKA